MIDQLKKANPLCLDIETTSINPLNANLVGIAFAFRNDLDQIQSEYISYNDLNMSEIKALLENPETEKIIHNFNYEYKVFKQYNIEIQGPIFDTMLASYCINPDRRHGLKELTKDYFEYEMTKFTELFSLAKKKEIAQERVRKSFDYEGQVATCKTKKAIGEIDKEVRRKAKDLMEEVTLFDLPVEEVSKYAKDDAYYTYKLYEYFKNKVPKYFYDIETPLAKVLANVELKGVAISVEVLKELQKEIAVQIHEIKGRIIQKAGRDFNPSSPAQVREVLFVTMGIQEPRTLTDSGDTSTSEKALQSIVHLDKTGIIQDLLDYRGLSKLDGTYATGLQKEIRNGKIHTHFNQASTSTGRLSSSEPNLQNIPTRDPIGKKIRAAFKSKFVGGKILSADYSQIELRILAHITEDPVLMEAFKNGEDIHTRTAKMVFKTNEPTKEQRYASKTINFALLYQQGVWATSKQIGVSKQEAEAFTKAYFDAFPKVRGYITSMINHAKEFGYTETLVGRKRFYDKACEDSSIGAFQRRAAVNAPIQGSSADLIKIAMINLSKELEGLESHIIATVHDEILLDVHPMEVSRVVPKVLSCMKNAMQLKVPLKVDVAIGDNWYTAE